MRLQRSFSAIVKIRYSFRSCCGTENFTYRGADRLKIRINIHPRMQAVSFLYACAYEHHGHRAFEIDLRMCRSSDACMRAAETPLYLARSGY
jgi:hypothetical protein